MVVKICSKLPKATMILPGKGSSGSKEQVTLKIISCQKKNKTMGNNKRIIQINASLANKSTRLLAA